MPMLLDTDSRTQTLVHAINEILAERGPSGLTMRRIADTSGVSTSSILHHLGSREHLLRVAAASTCRTRLVDLEVESATDGVLAFLPRNDDELLDTRAWLAWLEMWRCEDFLGRWIAECRADEMAKLTRQLDFRLTRPELDAAMALLDGLRIALCAPREPMRRDEARQLLAGWLKVPCTPVPAWRESARGRGWAAG